MGNKDYVKCYANLALAGKSSLTEAKFDPGKAYVSQIMCVVKYSVHEAKIMVPGLARSVHLTLLGGKLDP